MGAQQTWAWLVGIVLLLIAILGFVMEPPLLGFFDVNGLHNVVHLITGLLFIWAAWKGPTKPYNQWLGVIYIVVGIVGFFGVINDLLAINTADNWLHIVIGVISALVGWMAK